MFIIINIRDTRARAKIYHLHHPIHNDSTAHACMPAAGSACICDQTPVCFWFRVPFPTIVNPFPFPLCSYDCESDIHTVSYYTPHYRGCFFFHSCHRRPFSDISELYGSNGFTTWADYGHTRALRINRRMMNHVCVREDLSSIEGVDCNQFAIDCLSEVLSLGRNCSRVSVRNFCLSKPQSKEKKKILT